jgi:hypothetical protein
MGRAPPPGPRPRRPAGEPPARRGSEWSSPRTGKTRARVALARRRAELVYRAGRPISTTERSWSRETDDDASVAGLTRADAALAGPAGDALSFSCADRAQGADVGRSPLMGSEQRG